MAHKIPEPEEILKLAQELKEAREKAAELQSRWNSYFALEDNLPIVSQQDMAQPTLQSRIIALLESKPDQTFTTAGVTMLLDANPNSVGPLLSRAVADGKIARRGHGEYGAVRVEDVGDDNKALQKLFEEARIK
jgi:hypothetical protein